MNKKISNIRLENLDGSMIKFKNFAGEEGKFNPAGKRNFCIFLDDDFADKLQKDGWNIRKLSPKPTADDPGVEQAYIQVSVNYSRKPPKIVMVTGNGKTPLTDDTIKLLDQGDIESADIIITPYFYEIQSTGVSGIKAYVKRTTKEELLLF